MQTTVFERIPDDFVSLYDAQLQAWAAGFRRIGPVCVVRLARPVEPLVVSRDARRIVGVRLTAEVDRSMPGQERVVVRPQTDADEEAIRRHVVDMRAVLH
jgi:hypothetical protein